MLLTKQEVIDFLRREQSDTQMQENLNDMLCYSDDLYTEDLSESKNKIKLIAFLHDISGLITDQAVSNPIHKTNIEGNSFVIFRRGFNSKTMTNLDGMQPRKFLYFMICLFIALYKKVHALVELKIINSQISEEEFTEIIVQEIWVSINAFNIISKYYPPQKLEEGSVQKEKELYIPLSENDVNEFVRSFLYSLKRLALSLLVYDQISFPCGTPEHVVYLNFIYIGEGKFVIRLDNLSSNAEGINGHETMEGRKKPALSREFDLNKREDINNLTSYLRNVCLTRYKRGDETGFNNIYNATILAEINSRKDIYLPWMTEQKTGNCPYKSYSVGILCRIAVIFIRRETLNTPLVALKDSIIECKERILKVLLPMEIYAISSEDDKETIQLRNMREVAKRDNHTVMSRQQKIEITRQSKPYHEFDWVKTWKRRRNTITKSKSSITRIVQVNDRLFERLYDLTLVNKEELDELFALTKENQVLSLYGDQESGKTYLAISLIKKLKDEGNNVFIIKSDYSKKVFLHYFRTVIPQKNLYEELSHSEIINDESEFSQLQEGFIKYLTKISNNGQGSIVLIDGVSKETCDWVKDIISQILIIQRVKIIITSIDNIINGIMIDFKGSQYRNYKINFDEKCREEVLKKYRRVIVNTYAQFYFIVQLEKKLKLYNSNQDANFLLENDWDSILLCVINTVLNAEDKLLIILISLIDSRNIPSSLLESFTTRNEIGLEMLGILFLSYELDGQEFYKCYHSIYTAIQKIVLPNIDNYSNNINTIVDKIYNSMNIKFIEKIEFMAKMRWQLIHLKKFLDKIIPILRNEESIAKLEGCIALLEHINGNNPQGINSIESAINRVKDYEVSETLVMLNFYKLKILFSLNLYEEMQEVFLELSGDKYSKIFSDNQNLELAKNYYEVEIKTMRNGDINELEILCDEYLKSHLNRKDNCYYDCLLSCRYILMYLKANNSDSVNERIKLLELIRDDFYNKVFRVTINTITSKKFISSEIDILLVHDNIGEVVGLSILALSFMELGGISPELSDKYTYISEAEIIFYALLRKLSANLHPIYDYNSIISIHMSKLYRQIGKVNLAKKLAEKSINLYQDEQSGQPSILVHKTRAYIQMALACMAMRDNKNYHDLASKAYSLFNRIKDNPYLRLDWRNEINNGLKYFTFMKYLKSNEVSSSKILDEYNDKTSKEKLLFLFSCVAYNKVNFIKEILDEEENNNKNIILNSQVEGTGFSLLHQAVWYKRYEIVVLLLGYKNIKVNIKDNGGYSALHIAVYMGYYSIFGLLLSHEKVKVLVKNQYEMQPIDYALACNYQEMVLILIKHMKNDKITNVTDVLSITNKFSSIKSDTHRQNIISLYEAIYEHNVKNALDTIYRIKNNNTLYLIYHHDDKMQTCLHWAAMFNEPVILQELLKIMLENNLFANCKGNHWRWSPLHIAVACGHISIVQVILSYKECFEIRSLTTNYHDGNWTTLHEAVVSEASNRDDIVRLILEDDKKNIDYDSGLNWTEETGNTALFLAIMKGHFSTARILIDVYHALIGISNNDGMTVIDYAEQYLSRDFVRYLNKAKKKENQNHNYRRGYEIESAHFQNFNNDEDHFTKSEVKYRHKYLIPSRITGLQDNKAKILYDADDYILDKIREIKAIIINSRLGVGQTYLLERLNIKLTEDNNNVIYISINNPEILKSFLSDISNKITDWNKCNVNVVLLDVQCSIEADSLVNVISSDNVITLSTGIKFIVCGKFNNKSIYNYQLDGFNEKDIIQYLHLALIEDLQIASKDPQLDLSSNLAIFIKSIILLDKRILDFFYLPSFLCIFLHELRKNKILTDDFKKNIDNVDAIMYLIFKIITKDNSVDYGSYDDLFKQFKLCCNFDRVDHDVKEFLRNQTALLNKEGVSFIIGKFSLDENHDKKSKLINDLLILIRDKSARVALQNQNNNHVFGSNLVSLLVAFRIPMHDCDMSDLNASNAYADLLVMDNVNAKNTSLPLVVSKGFYLNQLQLNRNDAFIKLSAIVKSLYRYDRIRAFSLIVEDGKYKLYFIREVEDDIACIDINTQVYEVELLPSSKIPERTYNFYCIKKRHFIFLEKTQIISILNKVSKSLYKGTILFAILSKVDKNKIIVFSEENDEYKFLLVDFSENKSDKIIYLQIKYDKSYKNNFTDICKQISASSVSYHCIINSRDVLLLTLNRKIYLYDINIANSDVEEKVIDSKLIVTAVYYMPYSKESSSEVIYSCSNKTVYRNYLDIDSMKFHEQQYFFSYTGGIISNMSTYKNFLISYGHAHDVTVRRYKTSEIIYRIQFDLSNIFFSNCFDLPEQYEGQHLLVACGREGIRAAIINTKENFEVEDDFQIFTTIKIIHLNKGKYLLCGDEFGYLYMFFDGYQKKRLFKVRIANKALSCIDFIERDTYNLLAITSSSGSVYLIKFTSISDIESKEYIKQIGGEKFYNKGLLSCSFFNNSSLYVVDEQNKLYLLDVSKCFSNDVKDSSVSLHTVTILNGKDDANVKFISCINCDNKVNTYLMFNDGIYIADSQSNMIESNVQLLIAGYSNLAANNFSIDKNNRYLAYPDMHTVIIIDLNDTSSKKTLYGHTNLVMTVSFDDEDKLFSVGLDNQLIVWNLFEGNWLCEAFTNPMYFNNNATYVLDKVNDDDVSLKRESRYIVIYDNNKPIDIRNNLSQINREMYDLYHEHRSLFQKKYQFYNSIEEAKIALVELIRNYYQLEAIRDTVVLSLICSNTAYIAEVNYNFSIIMKMTEKNNFMILVSNFVSLRDYLFNTIYSHLPLVYRKNFQYEYAENVLKKISIESKPSKPQASFIGTLIKSYLPDNNIELTGSITELFREITLFPVDLFFVFINKCSLEPRVDVFGNKYYHINQFNKISTIKSLRIDVKKIENILYGNGLKNDNSNLDNGFYYNTIIKYIMTTCLSDDHYFSSNNQKNEKSKKNLISMLVKSVIGKTNVDGLSLSKKVINDIIIMFLNKIINLENIESIHRIALDIWAEYGFLNAFKQNLLNEYSSSIIVIVNFVNGYFEKYENKLYVDIVGSGDKCDLQCYLELRDVMKWYIDILIAYGCAELALIFSILFNEYMRIAQYKYDSSDDKLTIFTPDLFFIKVSFVRCFNRLGLTNLCNIIIDSIPSEMLNPNLAIREKDEIIYYDKRISMYIYCCANFQNMSKRDIEDVLSVLRDQNNKIKMAENILLYESKYFMSHVANAYVILFFLKKLPAYKDEFDKVYSNIFDSFYYGNFSSYLSAVAMSHIIALYICNDINSALKECDSLISIYESQYFFQVDYYYVEARFFRWLFLYRDVFLFFGYYHLNDIMEIYKIIINEFCDTFNYLISEKHNINHCFPIISEPHLSSSLNDLLASFNSSNETLIDVAKHVERLFQFLDEYAKLLLGSDHFYCVLIEMILKESRILNFVAEKSNGVFKKSCKSSLTFFNSGIVERAESNNNSNSDSEGAERNRALVEL